MARSRSPLPPSPTGSTPLLDTELCSITSVKPLMPVPVEPPRNLKPPPPLKPKPAKPPRKNLPARPMDVDENTNKDHNQNCDDSADYDDIEVRNDAWKTMGVSMMPHSERPFVQRSHEPNRHQTEEHHYDRLQHLGPTSKINNRPGYRHITVVAPPVPSSCPRSSSLENLVDMEPVRAADDSHLGYGVIRKKSVPADETLNSSVGPPHQVYNDIEYAIVCKPNRV